MQDRVQGYWYKNWQLVVATHYKNIRQLGFLIPNGVGKEMN
jgi:endo-alpha-1,4-polygalactosaminidase (GH114 family)